MRYRVGLTQTVYEGATVEVEAETAEAAEAEALKIANNGDVEWRFLDTAGSIEPVSIDLLPPITQEEP